MGSNPAPGNNLHIISAPLILSTLVGKVDSALQALRASRKADMKVSDLEEELAYSSLICALP